MKQDSWHCGNHSATVSSERHRHSVSGTEANPGWKSTPSESLWVLFESLLWKASLSLLTHPTHGPKYSLYYWSQFVELFLAPLLIIQSFFFLRKIVHSYLTFAGGERDSLLYPNRSANILRQTPSYSVSGPERAFCCLMMVKIT